MWEISGNDFLRRKSNSVFCTLCLTIKNKELFNEVRSTIYSTLFPFDPLPHVPVFPSIHLEKARGC